MKVMIDTNIFISAALFPHGRAAEALMKALKPPYQPVACDYVIEELRRKFHEKFPDKLKELDEFWEIARSAILVVKTPKEQVMSESRIRDPKDRPILRAALSSNVDLFLTGDKDFLESSVEDPRIISVAEFLER